MIHIGNCLDILPTLTPGSVQCCVTSPPYFGLRDYGVAGQHGSEESPEAFVANLVEVFRRVRAVLRDDGTVWLNLGDSYAGGGRGGNPGEGSSTIAGTQPTHSRSAKEVSAHQRDHAPAVVGDRNGPFKPKDLMGMPWAVAFALRADGWYLRQEIIWSKPNPMPESVTDRCTKSHEHLFLLSKSLRYHFDAEAIAEPLAESSVARLTQATIAKQAGSERVPGKSNGAMKAVASPENMRRLADARDAYREQGLFDAPGATRNKRSVWTVATQPFKEAHFATFPPALIEPCILAGSRPGDLVLDPYMGAGTTAVVCERLSRRWVGCELNGEYAVIANRRIRATQPGLPLEATA